jgi:hypothetical protein
MNGQISESLHYTKIEKPGRNKHPSLLGPLVSYDKIKTLGLYLQHFILIATYEWT